MSESTLVPSSDTADFTAPSSDWQDKGGWWEGVTDGRAHDDSLLTAIKQNQAGEESDDRRVPPWALVRAPQRATPYTLGLITYCQPTQNGILTTQE